METVATVGSVVLLLALAWQILGSVWNIVAIVLGLFRDRSGRRLHECTEKEKAPAPAAGEQEVQNNVR